MLKIGLTGGIASGKSLVATRLRELGAILVDADALAREVVEPGTPGLAAIEAEFGPDILTADGRLDRPALGAVIFADAGRRAALNAIVHPLVRARSAALVAEAAPGSVVVQDIPLLVESGQGSAFHLVLVVDATAEAQLRRMVQYRGMTTAEAESRMAAQATRQDRLAAADVVLQNDGAPADVLAQVDHLWEARLLPFARNIVEQRRAERTGAAAMVPHQANWAPTAARLAARIKAAAPDVILAVDHIGSTAVTGLAAKDVLDLQVAVPDLAAADRIAPLLAAAGFPVVPGTGFDTPKPSDPDPAAWQKRFHASADPGRATNVHVRAKDSPGWRYALMFRDWLQADATARVAYSEHKHALAKQFAAAHGTSAYATAKEPWFTDFAWPRMSAWAERTGWRPPSYIS